MAPGIPSLTKKSGSYEDELSNASSKGSKVKGFKNLFNTDRSSRKSSFNEAVLDKRELSKYDDAEAHIIPNLCPIDPSELKSTIVNGFKKSIELPVTTNALNKLNSILSDNDYTEYLKRPKYLKIFKKSLATPPICKRLFLAQELDQNNNDEDLERSQSELELGLTERFDATNISKTSSADSIGGQNLKARDKNDKKSIWALIFSKDGKYLASAGKGNEIKIWKVIASPLDRISVSKSQYGSVFKPIPTKIFKDHSNDILSLDWSKNNFLLSSSMDKTVKLWNLSKTQPLRTFVHDDFVTCVKFHPLDDRFFVSGCLDHKVRLWSILENEISYEFDAQNLVTAIGFTPSGSLIIVGTFTGSVYFLDTQSLELRHSMQLNTKKSNTGPKITGIETFIDDNDVKILLTSNDSKIRVISLKNRQLESYFKGPENNSSQMIATVSDNQNYVISGSENHYVYLWDLHNKPEPHDPLSKLLTNRKKRTDHCSFHAHHSVVTCSLIAPTSTLKILSLSNDFIYELNNDLTKSGMLNSKNKKQLNQNLGVDTNLFDREFIGDIIVTADDLGLIRVFRQDLTSGAREVLIDQQKNIKNEADKDHRLFLNNNVSTSSLLSRGRSLKNINENFPTDTVRSRSTTLDSFSKNLVSGLSMSDTTKNRNSNMVCDVCGSDKFSVQKSSKDSSSSLSTGFTNGSVIFSCSDCGNQINI